MRENIYEEILELLTHITEETIQHQNGSWFISDEAHNRAVSIIKKHKLMSKFQEIEYFDCDIISDIISDYEPEKGVC